MKSTIKIVSAFVIPFMVACGNGESGKTADKAGNKSDEHAGHKEAPAADGQAATKVQLKDDNLNAVYQHYVHLTTALVNEDAAEARVAANAIQTGVKQVSGGGEVAASASKISATGDIKAQRTEYSTLSNEMIQLVKKSGVSTGELYVDYCPMAMNDKGAYWLSSKKEILNPYFGDKMLNCGEVKETVR